MQTDQNSAVIPSEFRVSAMSLAITSYIINFTDSSAGGWFSVSDLVTWIPAFKNHETRVFKMLSKIENMGWLEREVFPKTKRPNWRCTKFGTMMLLNILDAYAFPILDRDEKNT